MLKSTQLSYQSRCVGGTQGRLRFQSIGLSRHQLVSQIFAQEHIKKGHPEGARSRRVGDCETE